MTEQKVETDGTALSPGTQRAFDELNQLVQDSSAPRLVLQAIAEAIQVAHRANAASWALLHRPGSDFLTLDVGPIFALSVRRKRIALIFSSSLDRSVREQIHDPAPWQGSTEFRRVKDVSWSGMEAKDFASLWPQIRTAFLDAVQRSALAANRTTYARFHAPDAALWLARSLNLELPEPDYGKSDFEGGSVAQCFDALVERVQRRYPGWSSFDHPEFVKDELDYKREAVVRARELLSQPALQALLGGSQFDEFLSRLDTIGKLNNLLYRGVPRQGDLGILYQTELDKPAFCRQVFELLHGSGESAERLGRYSDWVREQGLPNKWTFPTYFLFLCHPESEMFVKPSVASAFLEAVGSDLKMRSRPTAAAYKTYNDLIADLRDTLTPFGPRDMVDVQSFVWVSVIGSEGQVISPERRSEFERLFEEFVIAYLRAPAGRKHLADHDASRAVGRANYDAILQAMSRGEDVTDLVLLKLLPYSGSKGNRERGAWIATAPAVTKDVRAWFEGAGWAKSSDWPVTAAAFLKLLERCLAEPDALQEACDEFSDACPVKGMQSGLISPILNALAPDRFAVVNRKSRVLASHFTGRELPSDLRVYPEANTQLQRLAEEFRDRIVRAEPGARPADILDMMSHWLVAVKKYAFSDVDYWKIAPGGQARDWDEWRDNGFAAINWGELGDLRGLSRKQFMQRQDELMTRLKDEPGWTKGALWQVWHFSRIAEGDRVVANRGTSEVVGIGTVTGPYYFVQGASKPHRLPVTWDDVQTRRVNQPGWRKTLVSLGPNEFATIVGASTRPESYAGAGLPAGPEPMVRETPGGSALSARAFDLLRGIHETPRRDYYQEHVEEFTADVVEPFKSLFRMVISKLPPTVRAPLETENKLFSRFAKNDYGRGGAWDHFWGALYPKGGSRIDDLQLFLSVDHERLEYGFSFGNHASEAANRFARVCKQHAKALAEILRPGLSLPGLTFGSRVPFENGRPSPAALAATPNLEEWLREPGIAGYSARVCIPAQDVVTRDAERLSDEIAQAFTALFPLVLLPIESDPLPAVSRFVSGQFEEPEEPEAYPLEEMAAQTGMDEDLLQRFVRAIDRKGQAIIYGPPGTGKTHLARHLARHLVAGGDGFVSLVQFHPAYAYEDFVQGIRPRVGTGETMSFDLVRGRFLEFCQQAGERTDTCVLIIDEINRANLARVFGELMYLLEYREERVPMAAGGTLRIPGNVRIIGTMNTADRSIALVDHALRRRFAFLPLHPDYDLLRRFHQRQGSGFPVDRLVEVLQDLNRAIGDEHYEVGITFFLQADLAGHLQDIWRMEIEPYLEEYFFDQSGKVSAFRWERIRGKVFL